VMPNWAADPPRALDDTAAPTLQVHWDTFPGSNTAQSVIQFQARVSGSAALNDPIDNTATVEWTSMPGSPVEERDGSGSGPDDYLASDTLNMIVQKSLSKIILDDNLPDTITPDAGIGEILTYQVTISVPVVPTTDVILTDTLGLGLAFVDCVSITASAGLSTTVPGSFDSVCDTAAVNTVVDPANPASLGSQGRQVVYDFGDLGNSSGLIGTLTIDYTAVVLDILENQDGVTLDNDVQLNWSAGPLSTSASDVTIVEPDLVVEKTADGYAVLPGQVVTFTIAVRHTSASTADAHDVLLEDILPAGLIYVPGSLAAVSGVPPDTLDDSALPALRVLWDSFPDGAPGESVIQFQATVANVGPGTSIVNTARVEWSSLPGSPGIQSPYNTYSTERRYDPFSPAGVDVYNVTSSASLAVPNLPATGFAPGVSTPLPPQPASSPYAQLGDLWLEIPALGVRTTIVGIPTNSSGWDLTWLGNRAGYLDGTAYPTWNGNTGITGHVYMPNGKPGPFVDLHTLYWGQQVIIHIDGQAYIYEVRSVRRVWPNDVTVLGHAELPTLTLITCQGYDQARNEYNYRIAVRAVLISVQPENGSPGTTH